MKEAMDDTVDIENLKEKYPEKAIALIATRSLIISRGSGLIGSDLGSIHGIHLEMHKS